MRNFSFTTEQISRIVFSLLSEEMNWRFSRHIDLQMIADQGYDTPLGEGGLELSENQLEKCVSRAAVFFGQPIASLASRITGEHSIKDISHLLSIDLRGSLKEFSFLPAGSESLDDRCTHDAAEVFADACSLAQLIYGRRRIVSFVAPHSLMGFIATILIANLQGIKSLDVRAMTPEAISNILLYGDAVVATPTQWRYLVNEGITAPDNAMAVTFGEGMPADLAMEMRKAGFGAHRELYGSTENGLIGWRDSSSQNFMLFEAWRNDGDQLLRITRSGDKMPYTPMDILAFETDTTFKLAGRRDGAIQVGAINVFPSLIAQVVARHPAVEKCEIKIAEGGESGKRIVAQISLNENDVPSERIARDIDAWCRTNLRPFERPRIYNFKDKRAV